MTIYEALDNTHKDAAIKFLKHLQHLTITDGVSELRSQMLFPLSVFENYLGINEFSTEQHVANVSEFHTLLPSMNGGAIGDILFRVAQRHPTYAV